MPRGGVAAFVADQAVLFGAAWYLVPRWALLWVCHDKIFFWYVFIYFSVFSLKYITSS
jgi:hypothetical protein